MPNPEKLTVIKRHSCALCGRRGMTVRYPNGQVSYLHEIAPGKFGSSRDIDCPGEVSNTDCPSERKRKRNDHTH